MDLMVKDNVAFITGAGEGIGEEVALMLAKEGANVAIAGRTFSKVENTANKARELGAKVLAFQLDVTNQSQVNEVIQKTLDEFKKIDILVNTPGHGERKSFLQTTKEDWDFAIGLNLYGPMNCIRAVLDHMVERKTGKIVTVISDAGRVGEPGNCVYAAAKAGVVALTKSVAQEVGRYSININCVALSATRTPSAARDREGYIKGRMGDKAISVEEFEARVAKRYPLRRLGEVEDVANAICFFVSDRASFITGQTLSVDGGYCMVS